MRSLGYYGLIFGPMQAGGNDTMEKLDEDNCREKNLEAICSSDVVAICCSEMNTNHIDGFLSEEMRYSFDRDLRRLRGLIRRSFE